MTTIASGYRFGPEYKKVRHFVKEWTYRRKSDGCRVRVRRYRLKSELVDPNESVTAEKLNNLIDKATIL